MLKQPCLVNIRLMQNKDYDQVLNILYECDVELDKSELIKIKKDKDLIAIVAENSEIITGFATYSIEKGTEIKHIYVQELYRGMNVGKQIVDYIKKSSSKRGSVISIHINERNVNAQCFFRSQGFNWIKTNKKEFNPDDGYLMIWKK